MDEADLADIFSRRYLQGALAENAKRMPHGEGPECCERCGAIIPLPRREAMPGCTLCIDCQREREAEL